MRPRLCKRRRHRCLISPIWTNISAQSAANRLIIKLRPVIWLHLSVFLPLFLSPSLYFSLHTYSLSFCHSLCITLARSLSTCATGPDCLTHRVVELLRSGRRRDSISKIFLFLSFGYMTNSRDASCRCCCWRRQCAFMLSEERNGTLECNCFYYVCVFFMPWLQLVGVVTPDEL